MTSPQAIVRAPESVAGHLAPAFIAAAATDTLAAVLTRLRAARQGPVELVCLVDGAGRLLGALPLTRLFAHGEACLGDIADPGYPRVRPGDDQEYAASVALHHGVDALPVVDDDDRLVGVMTAQSLQHVLRREHVEDLHRLAGITREEARSRHAIEDPPLRRARHRLPWLMVGLVGSGLATMVMAAFESVLTARVEIAFFIPAIVYLADAVGTQTEAIAVRGLSLSRTGIGALLQSELRTGLLIGSALGLLAGVLCYAGFGDLRLAAAVGTSILFAGATAATLGLTMPWLLARLDVDPAFGSGPVATVLQDVLSILVYFLVLRLFAV